MRNPMNLLVISLILATLFAFPAVTNVSGEVLAKVSVDPHLNVALVNESFNVTIKVTNVRNLWSWQVAMSFNPDVLEAVRGIYGDFLSTQPQGTYQVDPVLNNTHGMVGLGEVTLTKTPGVDGSGTLGIVTFRVKADGESFFNITDPFPTSPAANATTALLDNAWPDNKDIPFTTADGIFVIGAKPVAVFSYSPESPAVNEMITFDASESNDADGVITSYEWSFGDGSSATGDVVQHAFTSGGTYSVNLTVTDNDPLEFKSSLIKDILIRFGKDIAVTGVSASSNTAKKGEKVSISVVVMNQGIDTATFDVTIYYYLPGGEADALVAGTLSFADLAGGDSQTLSYEWDTSDVALGDYRIKAVAATLAEETNTANNTFIDGTVKVEASSSGFPIEYAIAGIAVVAVVAVIAIFLLRRRKTP